jgi:hypothetical protein
MRDQWYGDKRDLVKWGVLLELARRYKAKHILQVLYQRPSTWERLEIDGKQVELNPAVLQHFRNTASISAIKCGAQIDTVSDTFHDRSVYLHIVLDRIRLRTQLPGIVFLDPDTGLQPPGKPGPKHVLESEMEEIWGALCSGDILVFYQHQTNYNGTTWIEPKKLQFEQALGIGHGGAKVARAPGIARDVVFFFIQKNAKGPMKRPAKEKF